MRKNQLFACALSVLLAASSAMTCYAATENHSDGKSHTVDSDVVNTDASRTAVSAETSGTSVTVNGDVESAGWGAYAKDEGTVTVNGSMSSERTGVKSYDSGSSVTVNGDLASEKGNGIDAENQGEVTVTGNVVTSSETNSAVWATDGANVSIGGNAVNSNAVTTGDHIPNVVVSKNDSSVEVKGDVKGTAYGMNASKNSTIDVGGSVESELRGVSASMNSSVSVGGDVTSSGGGGVIADDDSQVTVKGSVNSVDSGVDVKRNSSVSIGGDVASGGVTVYVLDNSAVSIGGNVNNTGGGGGAVTAMDNSAVTVSGDVTAVGVGVWADINSTVTVGGNVEAGGMYGVMAGADSTVTVEGNVKNNAAADAVGVTNDGKITVKGDAVGGRYGISIYEFPDSNTGAAVVLGTVTAGDDKDSYCINVSSEALTKDDVMKELPEIIVGELSSKNDQFVHYTDNSGSGTIDAKEVAQAIAEQILYYIDVQDTENGNIKIDSGTIKAQGYDVAHANDTVTVTVTADKGYEIRTVDGGKATAVKNGDGSWSITVPATGGVSISAIMAAIKQVDNKTGGDDSGNDNSTAPLSSAQKQPEYVSEKAADGSSVRVYGEAVASDGTKSGVVLSDSDVQAGVVTVYTGTGKTAGLPASVVNAISAVDGGNLAAVPGADLTGKKAVGGSMALGIVPDGIHNVPVSIYASGIPAGAVPFILFYNNMTGEWSLIPATVDPATGLVVFVLPDDGTAIIVC